MLWGLGRLVAGDARMALAGAASSAAAALGYASLRPSVVVVDLELAGASSVELIAALKERSGGRVLVHTGIGDRRLHEDAAIFGASGIVAADAPAERVLAAIAALHAGRRWNLGPAMVAPPRGDAEIAAAAVPGGEFLSAAERRALAALRERGAPAPPLADLVALYSKLGLRNRRELERFAALQELCHGESGQCADAGRAGEP